MKFVKIIFLLLFTTFSMTGLVNANQSNNGLAKITDYYMVVADKMNHGDSGIDFVTGGIKYVPFPKEKDVDFRKFLTLCFESGTTKAVDGAKRVLKLINSDKPWEVLDSVSYSATQTSLIGDAWKGDFMSCADAYQTIKANYWQRFRTHKAMSKFVNRYVADAEQLKAYLAEHIKKELKDVRARLL